MKLGKPPKKSITDIQKEDRRPMQHIEWLVDDLPVNRQSLRSYLEEISDEDWIIHSIFQIGEDLRIIAWRVVAGPR